MMALITFLGYIFAAYGLANMIVYASGPFRIFERWRNFTHSIHEQVGELFTCMMCLSTWIGLGLSAADIWLVPSIAFTPFNMVFGGSHIILTLLLDMSFTSGMVWVIHQAEEALERSNQYEEVGPDDDSFTGPLHADIIDDDR